MANKRKSNWADLKKLPPEASSEEVRVAYNEMVDTLIFNLKQLSFLHNFSSKVETVTIGAGATVKVYHGLAVTPKQRVILGNTGNGAITDGAVTEVFWELINRGSNTAIVNVAILRG